jgi:hypothetical protein
VQLSADKVISWSEPTAPAGVEPSKVYLGPDPFGLGGFQVAVATARSAPSRPMLRDLFAARKGRTQIQLVVAVEYDGTVHLFGPDPQAHAIELPLEQAERQLQSVLAEPDVLAATERFAGFRKASESTGISGFTNSGLFATHHIATNVPKRADWRSLAEQARPLLGLRRQRLIEGLGFSTQPGPNGTLLLSIGGHPPRAVAVLLDDSEQFDAKTQRFQLSPVAFGLAVASRQEVPWLVVLRKDQIRLYTGRDGVGVGAKGQAETFFEIDLSTIDQEYGALLPLIFSASALAADGTADELLRDSARYATELGARLRERIYDEIIPPLAVAVAERLSKVGVELDANGLSTAYRVTLRILFRLLFQAYAEDRGLLPSGRNEGFDANSLKSNARRLLASETDEFGDANTIWFDLVQVWNAIDQGNPQWQIPSYNGGLFSTDPVRSPEGALIEKVQLPDRVLGPVLKSLLIDITDDGVLGPVDFRSLSVRQFGTIYEGLLESSLSRADEDLTVDASGSWVPAKEGDEVWATSGSVYFHTASGERKATGSYFTPKVIVDHLVEESIVPVLASHLDKIAGYLEKGDAAAAARDFFDFRVADLAMGSGHFLVAAVDKIESRMRTFLTEHSVPGVTEELLRLAAMARDALGTDDVAKSEVDEVGLLRRQVARRCIYGLDVNPMAVELARLALWIHTFVPGLPMSNLDHGLVTANSLTGVGTIEDALDALQPGRQPGEIGLFDEVLTDELAAAKTLLIDVANASEASKAEVEQGARLLAQARQAADTARRIFDAAIAALTGAIGPTTILDQASLSRLLTRPEVAAASEDFQPAHMPYLFPEVFLRADPGFDVLVGNPPWEKVRHEPQQFWVLRDPGLNALPAAARAQRIEILRDSRPVDREEELQAIAVSDRFTRYFSRAYRLQSSQHYDFAKLFAERNLDLVRASGAIGLVLPQALLVLGGWKPIRETMVRDHRLVIAPLRNTGGWAFENVHASTAICVLTVRPGSGATVRPAANSSASFAALRETARLDLSLADLRDLSDELNVPWFESPKDPMVFAAMSKFPRLGSGGGWIQGRADSTRWDFSSSGRNASNATDTPSSSSDWRVTMTRHVAPFVMAPSSEGKWVKELTDLVTPTSGLVRDGSRVLAATNHPPIIYRFPSRNDDSRTLVAAALPASGWLFSKGYAHGVLVPEETSTENVLALLGYLNSIPADWWARRFVDRHLGKRIIEGLPLPDWSEAVRDRVAHVVEGILVSNGVRAIAGPRSLNSSIEQRSLTDGLVEISALAFIGLGLSPDHAEAVFADFSLSEASLPASQRTAIVECMFRLGAEA